MKEEMSLKSHTELVGDRAGTRIRYSFRCTLLSVSSPLSPLIPTALGEKQSCCRYSCCMAFENCHMKNTLKQVVCFLSTHSSTRQNLSHSHPWSSQRSRQGRQSHGLLGSAITAGKTTTPVARLLVNTKAFGPPQVSHLVVCLSRKSPEYFYQTRKPLKIQYIDWLLCLKPHYGWKKTQHNSFYFKSKGKLRRLTVSKRSFSALSRLILLLYHLKAGKGHTSMTFWKCL